MIKNTTVLKSILITLSFLSVGCVSLPETSLFGGGRVNTASANQILNKNFESFDDLSLIFLLDPEHKSILTSQSGGAKNYYESLTDADKELLITQAFLEANKVRDGDLETTLKVGQISSLARRSQIQDRLIAASNQRCNLYTTYLTRLSNVNDGFFGITTTVLGSAGAIVTGEKASKVLSGLAGISSATRAELNQALFENVATSIIIPGIESNRREALKAIDDKRKKSLQEYSVEGAVADAINYHGLCNINAGINYAGRSLAHNEDMGIKKFTSTLAEVGLARNIFLSDSLSSISKFESAASALTNFQSELNTLKTQSNGESKLSEITKKISSEENLIATIPNGYQAQARQLDEELTKFLFDYSTKDESTKVIAYHELIAQQSKIMLFKQKLKTIIDLLKIEFNNIKKS